MRIAVIDSGINAGLFDLNEYVIHSTGFYINSQGYIAESNMLPVRNLHGTAVAMIIRHICSDVEFISVNVLDENLSTDGRVLAYALSQVFDYRPDIIHMSLGTLKRRYIFPLKKIIKEAKKLNVLLVAAAENSGKTSYPAYLNGVIGVKSGFFENYKQYSYKKGFFLAPDGTKGIAHIQEVPVMKNSRGTSMSAAYISGHLAEILKKYKNFSANDATRILINTLKQKE
ncbi:S8 family serine peptidase [Ruminiclostridium cellobioparum]|uniref:S8 family serine peptidase n=1 Tax=Ruminiclostridium cellobioparum TaxID=29355 RepID=UPI0024185B35|nr:S8 family serine peptidase [Ruminiclostridium cellobioparum]